jgi:hypothetical protein
MAANPASFLWAQVCKLAGDRAEEFSCVDALRRRNEHAACRFRRISSNKDLPRSSNSVFGSSNKERPQIEQQKR